MDTAHCNEVIYHLLKNIDDNINKSENSSTTKQNAEKSQIVLLKRKNKRNFSNPFRIQHSLPFHHVYKLFNTFGINQTALQIPDFQESFMRTYFYHRTITKVEKYHNAVLISIVPTSQQVSQPPVEYIIDKFKSIGDINTYKLASQVEELYSMLTSLKHQQISNIIQEDKESITKCLNMLNGDMFMCKFGLYKMAISNSLLQYIGYDVDEFAVQAIKYRTILFDFLSSNSYYKIASHAIGTVKHLMEVDSNKISEKEYLELGRMEFKDYIYSKNYTRSYCDLQYSLPMRGNLCIKVKKVIFSENELKWEPYGGSNKFYEQQRKNIIQKEYRLLSRMGVIPSNWLEQSKQQIAGYKDVNKQLAF